jgi:hypothetical protein
MEEIINEIKRQYFSYPILIFVLIVSIFISLTRRKKFKILKYFPIYLFWLLAVLILNSVCLYPNSLCFYLLPFVQYTDYFFTLVELIVFSNFFYRLIKNYSLKKGIVVINIIFAIYFIYKGVFDVNFYLGISEATQAKVYTIEAVVLLIICLIYFFQLFRDLPFSNLRDEPVFWVSAGVLFFTAGTLPYSLLENYIVTNYFSFSFSLYSIFYVFYVLLFSMIIKAYLCKTKEAI